MAVSDYVVAAICGCWYRESHINPGIYESLIVTDSDYMFQYVTTSSGARVGSGGYGFGQWTNTGTGRAMRRLNMHNWLSSHGYSDDSGNGQLAYFSYENWWVLNDSTYRTLSAFLSSTSTNLDELVRIFLANWEGVPGNALSERRGHASRFLKYIQENKNKTGFKWYSGNTYDLGGGYSRLSSSTYGNETYSKRSLSNLMRVYFYFSGYEPTDDEPEVPEPEEPTEEEPYTVTVTVSGRGKAYPLPSIAKEGDTIRLYEWCTNPYYFDHWEVTEGTIEISENQFTMPAENVTIIAVFEESDASYNEDNEAPTLHPILWLSLRPTWTWQLY